MELIAEAVKAFMPGSMEFLLAGLIAGVLLSALPEPSPRWGRRWLAVLATAYFLMSAPLAADWLMAGLRQGHGQLNPATTRATTIAVLGNGVLTDEADGRQVDRLGPETSFCLLEAARLYSSLDDPLIIVSGGIADPEVQRTPESVVMRRALIDLGVPADRILLESSSRNTREQVLNLADVLQFRRIEEFILVASPSQIRRAMALFDRAALRPVPSVSAIEYGGGDDDGWRLAPSAAALRGSWQANYEYLALAYYWLRGWV